MYQILPFAFTCYRCPESYYYFAVKKTGARRGEAACPRSQSTYAVELDSKPRDLVQLCEATWEFLNGDREQDFVIV